MKHLFTGLLAILGLASACGQQNFENAEVDTFTTKSGKTVKFHALVHASIRIDYDGKMIMVDPVTKLGDKTIDYAAMPKADFILITHEHFDHLDTAAIKRLTGDNTQLTTNQRCAEILGYGQVMSNGDMIELADGASQLKLFQPTTPPKAICSSTPREGTTAIFSHSTD